MCVIRYAHKKHLIDFDEAQILYLIDSGKTTCQSKYENNESADWMMEKTNDLYNDVKKEVFEFDSRQN